MNSKRHFLPILMAVAGLTLTSAAIGSSAFAADTPSPTPSTSASGESNVSDDDILTSLTVQADGSTPVQEGDGQVDAAEVENSTEKAAFDADINAAVQAGDSVTAAQLSAAETIVVGITAPEIQAIQSDDSEAHNLIAGSLQK